MEAWGRTKVFLQRDIALMNNPIPLRILFEMDTDSATDQMIGFATFRP
jgi:hypothetical protein